MKPALLGSLLFVLAVGVQAAAQPAPLPSASAAAPPATAPAPVPAAPDAGSTGLPAAPPVDDPRLAPMASAARVLGSWPQAVKLARERSTEQRLARATIERAKGAWRQTLARALPTVTGSSSLGWTPWDSSDRQAGGAAGQSADSSNVPWSWRASLGVSQPLLALQDWHAIETADRNVRHAELSAEDQERLMLDALANAIVAVLVAERMAELNRSGLRSALETLELTKTRERLGGGNALDIVRARQDVAQARSAVVSGDESVRQAREQLGQALGFAEPWGLAPGFDLAALESGLRQACQRVGKLEERADLAALDDSVDIARRDVDEVWLGFAPTVDLTGTLSTGLSSADTTLAGSWAMALSLTWPIFDGGARYGSLRSARAGVDQSETELEAAVRSARLEGSRADRGVSVADEERVVATEARDLAVETERLARLNYVLGPGTSLDLVQAAQQRRQAEIQLALKEFDLVGARIGSLLKTARCAPTDGATRAE